jgi:hypothetical protein
MAGTAAHLVDRLFPRVPVRQWVLSFPHAIRYRLAHDAQLVSTVRDIFIKTIFAFLIRRGHEFGATRKAQGGAVTFIQRFDSALGLNLHMHALVIDGIYAEDDSPDQRCVELGGGTQTARSRSVIRAPEKSARAGSAISQLFPKGLSLLPEFRGPVDNGGDCI